MTTRRFPLPLFLIFIGGIAMNSSFEPWNSLLKARVKFGIGVAVALLGAALMFRDIRARQDGSDLPPPNEEL